MGTARLDTIFQVSDLQTKRSEFISAARAGCARVRDKDGTSYVMLPESRLRVLEELASWSTAHLRLEELIRRGSRPEVRDLGKLAWLRVFDMDDLREFLDELHEALVMSHADRDTTTLQDCVSAWRITARQLEDPLRRRVLLGASPTDDFQEVGEPADDDSGEEPSDDTEAA